MAETYTLQPIGEVQIDDQGFAITVADQFCAGLSELNGFSHLNILFWCHYLDQPEYRELVISDRPYKKGPDQVGVFATRSPARPNPIALTAVPVLDLDPEAGIIRIAYIDAEPGSPVLDIKPYLPAVDRIREVATPQWCAEWPQWYEDSATFDWGAVFHNAR